MNNLPAEDDSSVFEEDLPSIDGAIIDNSGEMNIKPLAKAVTADRAKAYVQEPEAPSIEDSSTTSANEADPEVEEERIDSLEIESMLSELESFENRQSGKNTSALKPQERIESETNNAPEPQRARNTSAFTKTEVQRMLQELASIEAREEEAEEKKAAQPQQPSNRITRESKPVAPPTYQTRVSNAAASSADQKRDRRSLLIAAAVLCFCAMAITAGLIYERKSALLRIEQSLTASGRQQISRTNFELLDLVKKAPSKSGGSTIDQEITNALNRKHGRNWQPIGWKSDQESGENAASTVKFIWSERGVNKEAVWRIEAGTRKIKAANEDAAFFTR